MMKTENEKLREVLRCIADLPMDRCSTENDYRLSAAKAIALGALSQQDEPSPAQDDRKNTETAGMPVRDLYAAPIAQTAPQTEQSDSALLDALFNGQVAAEKAGMLNGTSNWALCLLRHIRSALSAKGESHE